VAKRLVVNDFWLVVNGDSASCKSHNKYSMHHRKLFIHVLCPFIVYILIKRTSRDCYFQKFSTINCNL